MILFPITSLFWFYCFVLAFWLQKGVLTLILKYMLWPKPLSGPHIELMVFFPQASSPIKGLFRDLGLKKTRLGYIFYCTGAQCHVGCHAQCWPWLSAFWASVPSHFADWSSWVVAQLCASEAGILAYWVILVLCYLAKTNAVLERTYDKFSVHRNLYMSFRKSRELGLDRRTNNDLNLQNLSGTPKLFPLQNVHTLPGEYPIDPNLSEARRKGFLSFSTYSSRSPDSL